MYSLPAGRHGMHPVDRVTPPPRQLSLLYPLLPLLVFAAFWHCVLSVWWCLPLVTSAYALGYAVTASLSAPRPGPPRGPRGGSADRGAAKSSGRRAAGVGGGGVLRRRGTSVAESPSCDDAGERETEEEEVEEEDEEAEEELLRRQVGAIVDKIVRDFIVAWYRRLTHDEDFPELVRSAMMDIAHGFRRRVEAVDGTVLAQGVLQLAGLHLETFRRARSQLAAHPHQAAARAAAAAADTAGEPPASRIAEAYAKMQPLHSAAEGRLEQEKYTRAIVDMLLTTLVPGSVLLARSRRAMVRELITCNVLLPTLDRLSDPDWINQMIVMLLSRPAAAPANNAAAAAAPQNPPRGPPAASEPPRRRTRDAGAPRRSSISVVVTDESEADGRDRPCPETRAHPASQPTQPYPATREPLGPPIPTTPTNGNCDRDVAGTLAPPSAPPSPPPTAAPGAAAAEAARLPEEVEKFPLGRSRSVPCELTGAGEGGGGGAGGAEATPPSLEVRATEEMVEDAKGGTARRYSAASGLDEAEEAEFFSLGSDEESPADTQRRLSVIGNPANPAPLHPTLPITTTTATTTLTTATTEHRRQTAKPPGSPLSVPRPLFLGTRAAAAAPAPPALPPAARRSPPANHGSFLDKLSSLSVKKLSSPGSHGNDRGAAAAAAAGAALSDGACASPAAASAAAPGHQRESTNIFHLARWKSRSWSDLGFSDGVAVAQPPAPPAEPGRVAERRTPAGGEDGTFDGSGGGGGAANGKPAVGVGPSGEAAAPTAFRPVSPVPRRPSALGSALASETAATFFAGCHDGCVSATSGGGTYEPGNSAQTAGLASPPEPLETIRNLRIVGTLTAKEHRGTSSHPYTLYVIKYETVSGETEPPPPPLSEGACGGGPPPAEGGHQGEGGHVAFHTVSRRYSEFLSLQTRLEERPALRRQLKQVKGPKKPFPELPFGNMDSEKVEARRQQLQTFLQRLCGMGEVAESKEMREFLALNTDARIAFVRKTATLVPRIDKMVVNLVDSLKTAFPKSEGPSPSEDESDGGAKKDADGKRKLKSKLFPARGKPGGTLSGDVTDVPETFSYVFDQDQALQERLSIEDILREFIASQTEIITGSACAEEEDTWPPSPAPQQAPGDTAFTTGIATTAVATETAPGGPEEPRNWHAEFSDTQPGERECGMEYPLLKLALDLVTVAFGGAAPWLHSDTLHRFLLNAPGALIESRLECVVQRLSGKAQWVWYLRALEESVWPGGVRPSRARGPPARAAGAGGRPPTSEDGAPRAAPLRTARDKAEERDRALERLMEVLGVAAWLVGSVKYRECSQTIVDSFQDPTINRHLVYSIWDLCLELLYPEMSEPDFWNQLHNNIC